MERLRYWLDADLGRPSAFGRFLPVTKDSHRPLAALRNGRRLGRQLSYDDARTLEAGVNCYAVSAWFILLLRIW